MRKRNRGQDLDLHANDWNRLCDIAGGGIGQQPGNGGRMSPTTVWVKNSLGRDLSRYAAVCICDTTPNELATGKNDQVYKLVNGSLLGRGPSYFYGEPILGVLQEPIADGRIGLALIAGVTPAQFRYNENGSTATADFADISDLDDKLTFSNYGPIRVISRTQLVNEANSTKYYLVELGTASSLGTTLWVSDEITWNSGAAYNYGNIWSSALKDGDGVRVGLYQVGTTTELRLGRIGRYEVVVDWMVLTTGLASGDRVDLMVNWPRTPNMTPAGGTDSEFVAIPPAFITDALFNNVTVGHRSHIFYNTGSTPIAVPVPICGIKAIKTTSGGSTSTLTITGRLRVRVTRFGSAAYKTVWTEAQRDAAWARGASAGPV